MQLSRVILPTGIALALFTSAGTALAQSDTGFYMGVGGGRTTLETRQLTASLPPQVVKVKDTSNSMRVFGGYRALKYLFIEAGAVAYGDVKENVGTGPDSRVFEASYGGFDLSLIGNAPLANGAFDVFGKIGMARSTYHTRIYDTLDPTFGLGSAVESTTEQSALYGVGVQFNIGSNKNVGVRVEYNMYDVSLFSTDQSTVLGSFVYRFSR